jgi:hypothetical protein
MRAFAGLLTFALIAAGGANAQEVQLNCNIGPVERTFGGTPWVVYGCDDGRSLVIATSADNPAKPFIFVIAWGPHGHRVQGEGSGDRNASAAAFNELAAMDSEQISTLYSSTLQAAE